MKQSANDLRKYLATIISLGSSLISKINFQFSFNTKDILNFGPNLLNMVFTTKQLIYFMIIGNQRAMICRFLFLKLDMTDAKFLSPTILIFSPPFLSYWTVEIRSKTFASLESMNFSLWLFSSLKTRLKPSSFCI
jgi:hypothetical protein